MIRRLAPLAALLATACATPSAPPPASVPAGPFAASPVAALDAVPEDWWRLYDDPVLDRLVRASLAANADLRVAFANLDGARAALSQARALRLPQTMLESAATVDNPSAQPSAANVSATDYDVAATASWDIDLFGRLRAGALAAKADADASAAALDGVRVAVVADTVAAYVDLCGATAAGDVARQIVAAQERSVAAVREQYRAGEVSPLEVSQAATLLEAARATLPPFEAARAGALYRLATLQGLPPAAARGWQLGCTALPRLARPLPVGDGSALLLRRPDIREAERKLAAASARIGVARADLYPRVNLGGAIGLLAGGFAATASPLISWAFPNQGPVRAKLTQARATERAALASWDVAILRALREVESGLATLDGEVRRNRALGAASGEADTYARRAAARVRLGDADPLIRYDAERARANAALQRVQSDIAIGQAQVALFRALGGGWQGAPVPLAPGVGVR
ncbi:efflux transporter outer membrane subunit [Sphingomonas naphthae]|uniref:Efflux transporter outer membrane subunit n=1 Tax=Sphingomonas naphthae TaxID=1813468 RepID=A0ABY7TIU7_9SPHN|nr:efflux transporter outer membrane subunit [Sphingomonas naphthae]WCT73069.1 efflux transporter outer membrane subunit [Sphingomonas naphthae]